MSITLELKCEYTSASTSKIIKQKNNTKIRDWDKRENEKTSWHQMQTDQTWKWNTFTGCLNSTILYLMLEVVLSNYRVSVEPSIPFKLIPLSSDITKQS